MTGSGKSNADFKTLCRRKLWIPERLIHVELNKLTNSFLTIFFIAIGAAIIVSIDTIGWLLTIFALSGPMLVSGVYEAYLDNILLEYVQNHIETGGLNTIERARVLYTILVGNLDIDAVPVEKNLNNSAWNHINSKIDSLLSDLELPNNAAPHATKTKTRLRTMLASQYSFGVTVGAPVVFFCASFIYGLFDNYANLGDNDTSHALGKSTLIPFKVHNSLIVHSIWNVVDDDTSHRDSQWMPPGGQ